MKLIQILLEQEGSKPKVIIMAGGAGAGKSYLLNQLELQSLPQVNPDKYVEDPNHSAHNNLGVAAQVADKEAEALSNKGESFVWDTTASNPQKVKSLVDKGYDVYMVMVYTHPMISYIANFERERNIPATAVFSTWRNVYQLIEDYNQMTGGNLSIFINDRGGKYTKEVEAFDAAAKKGASGIKEYLKKYNEEKGIGGSTFFKPVVMSREEEEAFKKETASIDWNQNDRSEDKAIKQEFLKSYNKIGAGPGADKLVAAVKKYREAKDKRDKGELDVLDAISNMLYSPTFQSLLTSSSPQEIDQAVQNFLA